VFRGGWQAWEPCSSSAGTRQGLVWPLLRLADALRIGVAVWNNAAVLKFCIPLPLMTPFARQANAVPDKGNPAEVTLFKPCAMCGCFPALPRATSKSAFSKGR
jgi:hypothetical protein